MQWFEGSIVQAVTEAKNANAIFVVYVHDSSEASTQTDLVLNDTEVSSVLSTTQFVAIKLENGTDGAKQFSQIYPLVLVPSLFFISGQSGVPLEIVGGAFSRDDLLNKLYKLNPTCEQDNSPVSQSNKNKETEESASSESKETADLEKDSSMEAFPTAEVDTIQETTSSEAPTTRPPAAQDTESSACSPGQIDDLSNVPLEERLERAKIILEEKQANKQKEKEEEDRRKEVERRQTGKDVAKQRQLQHEEELRNAAEERRKDKQDDKLARERVKAQIAADRAEREARNAALRGEQSQDKSLASSDSTGAATAYASASASASQCSHSVCRIKFRLPDGSSSVAQFPPESLLCTVREHIDNNIALPFRAFDMTSTMRPHPFSQDDLDKSLIDLDLVPSAILIITPRSSGRSGAIAASNESMLNILWLILSPITFILGLVRSLFGGSREQSRDPRRDNEFKTEEPVSKKPREEGSSTTRKRPKTAYGSRGDSYRREGNIHRFSNKDDDDDENNTWNGNSTQQM